MASARVPETPTQGFQGCGLDTYVYIYIYIYTYIYIYIYIYIQRERERDPLFESENYLLPRCPCCVQLLGDSSNRAMSKQYPLTVLLESPRLLLLVLIVLLLRVLVIEIVIGIPYQVADVQARLANVKRKVQKEHERMYINSRMYIKRKPDQVNHTN